MCRQRNGVCVCVSVCECVCVCVCVRASVLPACAGCPQEVNATVAQNGSRLTLGELDTEGVERWVDHKKAQVGS